MRERGDELRGVENERKIVCEGKTEDDRVEVI